MGDVGNREAHEYPWQVMPDSFPALPFLSLEEQRERRKRQFAVFVNNTEVSENPENLGKPTNNMVNLGKPSHTQTFQLKVAARRRRVYELRALGLKHLQIQEGLAKEGQFWSLDTIGEDLRSETTEEKRSEFERLQSWDIAMEEDRKVRLEFRARMIENLTPRKSPDVQVQVSNQTNIQKKFVFEIVDNSGNHNAGSSRSAEDA